MTLALAALGSGLVLGFAVALTAVGFTVIYNATRVLNFANGQQMLLGGYVGLMLYVWLDLPFWLSLIAGAAAGFLLGVVLDRVMVGPLRNQSVLTQVIALFAAANILDGVYLQVFGSQAYNLPPYASPVGVVPGLSLSPQDLAIIGSCAVLVLAVLWLLYRTEFGVQMRATAENPVSAALVGIDPRLVSTMAWGMGGAMAALAGLLLMPKFILSPDVGQNFTFDAFAAVAVGGFGSLTGAIIGGVVIGLAEAAVDTFVAAGYEPLVSLGVMLLVLAIRPTGLVGERA